MSSSPPQVFVLDSSAVIALLVDAGPIGDWVDSLVSGAATLAAPELMRYEAANVLRRQLLFGKLDNTAATLAHQDLGDLPIELYPYSALAERIWELRRNITVYDAAYVALAELLQVPLITLDAKLARDNGPSSKILECEILPYPGPN